MAPSEYSLRLQKGIVGGFAPPTPDAIYTITRPKDHADINIAGGERPTGTPSLQEFAPKSIPHSDAVTLIDELHGILKDLPTEQPPGSEDIYGLNTSIAWGSDDLEWFNGGPAGCGGGESSVKATAQQKEKFKRAVEIVEHLVKKDK
ncbi:hypothetical protein D9756_010960 [Leucocoprinus leucothites]|uniref:Uncharacterized protein n=1 Tax=Leucocoprinus leucothites TaxID=201217 RepID=A0A8H5CNK3_9AGAR|nr:hypothetical protein D9756_011516 [Leucoagaricus leucothites]KAF5347130.1 hypothetical protein D9756_010960 [Leucoagaricus leucothites]